jgi:pimeloyl-ACP methyl ester carboxylesterase
MVQLELLDARDVPVRSIDWVGCNGVQYDWRVPPNVLEKRDAYFTEVAAMIRKLVRTNGKPVVIIGHSLGMCMYVLGLLAYYSYMCVCVCVCVCV